MPQRWIDRRGAKYLAHCVYPARSPDLIVYDFLWREYVKDKVYVPMLFPVNIDDMKDRMTAAINTTNRDMLMRVWKEFSSV